MGLLSSIGSRLKYTVSTLSDIANPFDKDFGKVELEANIKNKTLKSAVETVANHPYTSAAVAATAISSAGRAAAATVAKSVGTKFAGAKLTTQVATVALAPAVIGAVAKKPVETANLITSYPSKAATLGADIASFAADPSLKSGKELVTEHKAATAAIGVAGAVGFAKFVPAISTYLSSRNVSKATEEAAKKFTAPIVLKNDTSGLSDEEKAEYKVLKQYLRDVESAKSKGKIDEKQFNILTGRAAPELPPMTNPQVSSPAPATVNPAVVAAPIPAAPPLVSTAKPKKKKKAPKKKKPKKKAKKRKVVKKKAPKKKKKKAVKRAVRRKPKKTTKKRKVYKKKKTKKR